MFHYSSFALPWLSLICGAVVSLPAVAQEPASAPLAAGYWQAVSRPEMQGAAMLATPRTKRFCLSADDVKAGRLPLPTLPSCEVQGGAWSGHRLALQFQCVGMPPKARMQGEVQAAGTAFNGRVDVVLDPDAEGVAKGQVSYLHAAQWMGPDCPAQAGVAPAAR